MGSFGLSWKLPLLIKLAQCCCPHCLFLFLSALPTSLVIYKSKNWGKHAGEVTKMESTNRCYGCPWGKCLCWFPWDVIRAGGVISRVPLGLASVLGPLFVLDFFFCFLFCFTGNCHLFLISPSSCFCSTCAFLQSRGQHWESSGNLLTSSPKIQSLLGCKKRRWGRKEGETDTGGWGGRN